VPKPTFPSNLEISELTWEETMAEPETGKSDPGHPARNACCGSEEIAAGLIDIPWNFR
jgi:hypothetical protein